MVFHGFGVLLVGTFKDYTASIVNEIAEDKLDSVTNNPTKSVSEVILCSLHRALTII